ncbi:MAG: hypothetical protein C0438_11405 [Pseudomonas sp.]|nr:hypothetical protein [Pseudomonas sp.]
MLDVPALSRAGSLPQWICADRRFTARRTNPVGAGLPAIADYQTTIMLNVPAPSRAGSLPQ